MLTPKIPPGQALNILGKIIPVFPLLFLASCALNPGAYPVYVNGKKAAVLQAKGPGSPVIDLTVFNEDGDKVYASDFLGGCNGIPQAGKEIIGSRTRFDKEGEFQSKWEIDHDTVRAVYTEKFPVYKMPVPAGGKLVAPSPRLIYLQTAKYVYRRQNIDSIVFTDDSNRVTAVANFGGKVCINLSPLYYSYLNGQRMGFGKGQPYLYDTLVLEDFNPATGKLSMHTYQGPDSIIQTSYHKNGKMSKVYRCALEDNDYCKTGNTTEWFENGHKSTEEGHAGSHIVHRHYWEAGGPSTESFYIGTKLDSTYRSWHENGTLYQRIEYAMGQETKSEEWDEKGKKIK